MLALLRAYRKYDPAARSLVEVLLLYPGVKAIAFYRAAHFLEGLRIPILPRAVSELGRFVTGIEIHPGAKIGAQLVIDHGMGVVIGETAVIGDQVVLYHGVTLGGRSRTRKKRHPSVGDRVIIGAGATLLGDIEIGSDARIGAHALVLADVPAGATVVGVHGRASRESQDFPAAN